MRGDALEDAGEGSGFQGLMVRDDLVIFAIQLRGHPDVRTVLAGRFVTEDTKSPYQRDAVEIARQLHAASTSSRTK